MTPLFVPTIVALEKALGASSIDLESDKKDQLHIALTRVRIGFFDKLGASIIATIQGTAHPEAPTTDAQYLRVLAEVTEITWTRRELLSLFSSVFQEGAADGRKNWNENSPYRKTGASEVRREINRLDSELATNLDILAGNIEFGASLKITGTIVEPETDPFPIGASIWPTAVKSAWENS